MGILQLLDDREFEAFVPHVRTDLLVRQYDNEAVVWSPISPEPAYLQPLAGLVFELLDGATSVADLVADVHEVVGVPRAVARNQLRHVVDQLDRAALLTTSTAPPDSDPDLFPGPPNP